MIDVTRKFDRSNFWREMISSQMYWKNCRWLKMLL